MDHIIFNVGRVGSEWVFEGVTNNSKLGTSERIREKMLKIGEKARAAADERAIEDVDFAAVGEERLRSENRSVNHNLKEIKSIYVEYLIFAGCSWLPYKIGRELL